MERRFTLLKKFITKIVEKVMPKVGVEGDVEITYGIDPFTYEARVGDTYFMISSGLPTEPKEVWLGYDSVKKQTILRDFDPTKECVYVRDERMDMLSLAPKFILIFLCNKLEIRYHTFKELPEITLRGDNKAYVFSDVEVAYIGKRRLSIPFELFNLNGKVKQMENIGDLEDEDEDEEDFEYRMYGMKKLKQLFDYTWEESDDEILGELFDEKEEVKRIECPICLTSVPAGKSFKPTCGHSHCCSCAGKITKCSLCRKEF